MNQRRDLQDLYDHGIIEKQMLKSSIRGTVFVCDSIHHNWTDQEIEWVGDNVMHTKDTSDGCFPKVVPFPVFRLYYPKEGSYIQCFFDMESDIAVTILRAGHLKDGNDPNCHFRFGFRRSSPEVKSNVWINFKPIEIKGMEDRTKGVFDAQMRDLIYFLFEVMSSYSTILKVTDDQPGRSVQWRLNREHYLVLNHHQAQTMQRNKRGVTDADIVRGAHWRRSHLRRLNSEKFKHKRGLIVPVKKAWVGPKEWKGHDGKIYKVYDQNDLKTKIY